MITEVKGRESVIRTGEPVKVIRRKSLCTLRREANQKMEIREEHFNNLLTIANQRALLDVVDHIEETKGKLPPRARNAVLGGLLKDVEIVQNLDIGAAHRSWRSSIDTEINSLNDRRAL